MTGGRRARRGPGDEYLWNDERGGRADGGVSALRGQIVVEIGQQTLVLVHLGQHLAEGALTASFDGRTVSYLFGELDTLVLAYAATIHKSQGSEYPAVVIPVLTQHYAMLQRNLLYTGITRGKRLVVIVGQRKAVAIAVKNVSGRRRWSKLDEWLGHPQAMTGQLME